MFIQSFASDTHAFVKAVNVSSRTFCVCRICRSSTVNTNTTVKTLVCHIHDIAFFPKILRSHCHTSSFESLLEYTLSLPKHCHCCRNNILLVLPAKSTRARHHFIQMIRKTNGPTIFCLFQGKNKK